jgi:hypothetical protein
VFIIILITTIIIIIGSNYTTNDHKDNFTISLIKTYLEEINNKIYVSRSI